MKFAAYAAIATVAFSALVMATPDAAQFDSARQLQEAKDCHQLACYVKSAWEDCTVHGRDQFYKEGIGGKGGFKVETTGKGSWVRFMSTQFVPASQWMTYVGECPNKQGPDTSFVVENCQVTGEVVCPK